MEQTREAMAQNLAERLCWQVARRDDSRVARRLYRKQVVDGVYPLDEGALLDDFFYFLQELGVGNWLGDVQGTGIQREMVPVVQYVLLYSLKTLFGIESMHALPTLLFSDEALMRLVGFSAHQVRHGVWQRGAAQRQGPRTTGPICPDALADNIVQLNPRDLEAWFNGVIRARPRPRCLPPQLPGEGITMGRRAHTVRHGQGKTAWSERLETEVVGIAGLTTYDQYGTPEHGRHHNRRDFQPNAINAVVVRKWHGRDYGPGAKRCF